MEAISLEQAQNFIQIGGDLADGTIESIVNGAESFVRKQTGIYYTETDVTEKLPGGGKNLWPSHGPIISVSSIYTTEAGSTVSDGLYEIVNNRRINYDYGRWQEGQRYWTVEYTAGYGNTIAIPDDLKLIILQLTARWFENRRGAESEDSAGHSITFRSLADTDMMQRLELYQYGEPA